MYMYVLYLILCVRAALSREATTTSVTVMTSFDIAFGGVTIEPILIPEQDRNGRPMLQADWLARGVWQGNRVAFFDNRIVDADAPSYAKVNLSWNATANKAAAAKKRKYKHAAEELRGSFTPLVCSTDAVLHHEYSAYQKRLTSRFKAAK